MRVVIDTNVIVSALLNANGIPASILALVLNGKLNISYDNRIIFEYINVLSRKEFCFDSEIINSLINYIRKDGEYVSAIYPVIEFSDKTDKKFYEVYKAGAAEYLITGNIKHFPKEKTIITPRDFMEILVK